MSYSAYYTANFGSSYAGLVTVGYQLLLADGTVSLARTTTGVAESPAGSGIYGATVTLPDTFEGSIVWDTGTTPNLFGTEDINSPPGWYTPPPTPPTVDAIATAVLKRKTVIDAAAGTMQVYDLTGTTVEFTLAYTLDSNGNVATITPQ